MLRWAFGCKVTGEQVFYFRNGKVKSLRIDNIWNFATFNLYTVPAKILYLHRYSTDFQNVWHSSKILRVGIWVERFKRAGILLLQWQGENFAHVQHLKFPIFNLYPVTAKIPYLQRYSTDLRNLCHNSKILRVGNLVENFRRAAILHLQWQAEIVAYRQHLKFCHFQHVQCPCKNPISPKVFNRFSWVESFKRAGILLLQWKVKTLRIDNIWNFATFNLYTVPEKIFASASARRFWGWAFGWKVSSAQIFYFCNGKVRTLRMYNIWNFPFSICTLSQQKFYISKGIPPIFEIFATTRRFWGWAIWWKISGAQLFYICNASWNLCLSTTFEILPLSTCTMSLQKSYISKGIHPIFEIFATARIFWGWVSGWKVSSAQVFCFCNGEWKLCASTTFEILPLQPVHCARKSPISPKVFNRFSKS